MKKCRQRNSGIGGQAVLEGVMMRNGENYAIAVRKSDGSIVLKKETYRGVLADSPLKKFPFVRGVLAFIDSMILGLRCTDYSATIYAEDDPEESSAAAEKTAAASAATSAAASTGASAAASAATSTAASAAASATTSAAASATTSAAASAAALPAETAAETSTETAAAFAAERAPKEQDSEERQAAQEPQKQEAQKQEEQKQEAQKQESLGERILTAAVMVVSLLLALGLFMVLPYFLASHVIKWVGNAALLSLFEGVIRIAIFVGYILVISQMRDIRRLFQYHGAEHKCINCLESGMELTVENASKATRLHKRCGSSFILFVMMVSIVLFFFIRVRNPLARVGLRILLLPVISGISYELIRFAGSSDNPVIGMLSKPGLWLQGLTTREPDEEMLKVAISSVEAVFDWRAYLEGLV